MNNSAGLDVIQGKRCLNCTVHCFFRSQSSLLINHLLDRQAIRIFVRDIVNTVLIARKINSSNIVMVQLSTRASFVSKSRHQRRIGGNLRMQNFQGNITRQLKVNRPKNGPHSASANLLIDFKVAKPQASFAMNNIGPRKQTVSNFLCR